MDFVLAHMCTGTLIKVHSYHCSSCLTNTCIQYLYCVLQYLYSLLYPAQRHN